MTTLPTETPDDSGSEVRVVRPEGLPFAMVAVSVMRDTALSCNAKALYGLLVTYADISTRECYPSRRTLAENLGVSVATLDRTRDELVAYGLLEIRARHATTEAGKTTQLPNLFVLHDAAMIHRGSRDPSSPVSTPPSSPVRSTPPHGWGGKYPDPLNEKGAASAVDKQRQTATHEDTRILLDGMNQNRSRASYGPDGKPSGASAARARLKAGVAPAPPPDGATPTPPREEADG
jgi:hypothetical protein